MHVESVRERERKKAAAKHSTLWDISRAAINLTLALQFCWLLFNGRTKRSKQAKIIFLHLFYHLLVVCVNGARGQRSLA